MSEGRKNQIQYRAVESSFPGEADRRFDGIKKFYPPEEYMVSTIKQPLPELAKKCIDMILDEENCPMPSLTLLPVSYEYGGTTIH